MLPTKETQEKIIGPSEADGAASGLVSIWEESADVLRANEIN